MLRGQHTTSENQARQFSNALLTLFPEQVLVTTEEKQNLGHPSSDFQLQAKSAK